jgi:hypothetical protein|tara:strand:- start:53 stop:349 length:297 start_codon:yes stop_codon:yes gene_type:complete
MKLFTSIAAAAVIGGSFLIAPTPAEARRNCPAGTSYHKIKTGGLLIKRTIAEGCFASYEAAQLKMQAAGIEQQRRNAVMRNAMSNDTCTFFGNTMQCY